jgi:hypothetical protein
MALRLEFGDAFGDIPDALGVAHRGAAVFLNNQRHGFVRLNVKKGQDFTPPFRISEETGA